MGKRKTKTAVAFLLVAASLFVIFTVLTRNQNEMAQVKDAMRNLRRANNLKFSYQNTFSDQEGEQTSEIEVWVDQLTGQWIAEYSVSDEDGVWMYLKQFCDGLLVYDYDEWSEEWTESETGAGTEAPYIEEITAITYGNQDISDLSSSVQGEETVIVHSFTEEYKSKLMVQNQSEMEQMFEIYEDWTASEDTQEVSLAVTQYQNTKITEACVSYRIDEDGMLRRKEYTLTLVRPQLVTQDETELQLGDEEEISIQIVVKVTEYNDDSVTDKIETGSPLALDNG